MTDAVDQNTQQPAQPQGPDLTVTDLQNLRAIIDVACTRGAFKAAEMAAVGAVFTKLDTFLKAVAPAAPAQDGATQ
jgi:hypothetical protein